MLLNVEQTTMTRRAYIYFFARCTRKGQVRQGPEEERPEHPSSDHHEKEQSVSRWRTFLKETDIDMVAEGKCSIANSPAPLMVF